MAQEWFIIRGGKEYGPYTSQQLRDMAANGQVVPDDLVRRRDTQKQSPAKLIKGLPFPNVEIAAPKPPPPAVAEGQGSSPATPASQEKTVALSVKGLFGLAERPKKTPPPILLREAPEPKEPSHDEGQSSPVKAITTPKTNNWKALMENPLVIGILVVACFPVGLCLVWTHSNWSTRRKAIWTGAFVCFLIFAHVVGSIKRASVEKDLLTAAQLAQHFVP